LVSLFEIETLLIIKEKVHKLKINEINEVLVIQKKLLLAFIKHLKNSKPPNP
jgi:hypothetical protein